MEKKELKATITKLEDLIKNNRISAFIYQMSGILTLYRGLWALREKLDKISVEYTYLRDYALNGIEDPSRAEMFESIKGNLLDLLSEFERSVLKSTENTLYFSSLRWEDLSGDSSIDEQLEEYLNYSLKNHLTPEDIRNKERLGGQVFHKIWITYPLSKNDIEKLYDALKDSRSDETIRNLIIYAVFLGLMEYYEESRIRFLAEIYQEEKIADSESRIISLVCLMIGLWVYRHRLSMYVEKILESIYLNDKEFTDDVQLVMLALLRAGDTERITKKMHDDIIPVLTKIKPDIEKKIKEMNDFGLNDDLSEVNPEWENLLEEAGIAEKMRELSDLQSEGNDLMMVTFSHLKSFPFFNDIQNWFLPFSSTNSNLKNSTSLQNLYKLISDTTFFCESDKYSMVFSLSSMPLAQLNLISEQINIQNNEMNKIISSSLLPEEVKKKLRVTKTVQNLYRFFKLFKRRSEFKDPFDSFILLSELDLLKPLHKDINSRRQTAEFLFRKGYYLQAVTLFNSLIEAGVNDNELYQKAAYSYQKAGDIKNALRYYKISDLMDSENLWNLRRLGFCARYLGKHNEALKYYERILEKKTNDISATLSAGLCQMELENYEEAIKLFHKAEFLDETSLKPIRPIAWCSLLIGKYDKAENYYNKINEAELTSDDYLNKGHLSMIRKDYKTAIEQYSKSYCLYPDKFAEEMKKDRKVLLEAGVDNLMIDIVIESIY
ncbi:MAG: hypothetical protein J1E38_05830 [Paramuribaculum sp.]|nr:hypothetical protein [Paramuribaculum sp.]